MCDVISVQQQASSWLQTLYVCGVVVPIAHKIVCVHVYCVSGNSYLFHHILIYTAVES